MRTEEALPRRIEAAPRARRLAARTLGEEGPSPSHHAVALVVTELVANAVTHGRGRRFSIRMEAHPGALRVEVANRCWTGSPRRRPNVIERPSGRGLKLVEAFSRRWGVVPERRWRTRVWAEIPLDDAVELSLSR